MSFASEIILFIFGLAIGSFLNVVALRYDGDHFVFSSRLIGGRSHCPHCQNTLQWFELIPVISFVIQGARCRNCKARIGWQYPAVELLSGIIFAAVPFRLTFISALVAQPTLFLWFSALWIFAFEMLLLIAYIDILLNIIPDELNLALGAVGIIVTILAAQSLGAMNLSFLAPYSIIFGLQSNVWMSHLIGALFGGAFFGGLVAITRGRGMGIGDIKLAVPLGLLFGWPDILVITMLAFIIGGILGLALISSHKKSMKSTLPFGPFIVLGTAIVFFAGSGLFTWYFHMLGL
jgi:prepilin signal peptidase PulO-like enzyme (type II secretory pathway)